MVILDRDGTVLPAQPQNHRQALASFTPDLIEGVLQPQALADQINASVETLLHEHIAHLQIALAPWVRSQTI